MTFKLRVKVKYLLKSVFRLVTQTPHSCIDRVPSYQAQWLLMKRSYNQGFILLMWPWSQRQGCTCIEPIYSSYSELLCHFLSESVHICQNEWCIVCFIWSCSSQSIFFSVKSYQDCSFLGWTGTKQDLMCLACHVYFLQPCGHLLGKGWPFGPHVCDVFLLFFVTFPYHTVSWVMCVTSLYRFLSFAFIFTLLTSNMQFHQWDSNLQPFYLDSSILPQGTALAYCVVNRWKSQITAMTLE